MFNEIDKYDRFPYLLISLIPLSLITGPAIPDISVSVCCILFIYFIFKKKITNISNSFIFYSIFFWVALIFLNLISINIYKSSSESFIFLRLLLIPIIMYFWLFRSNKHIHFLLLIIFISNLIVILDTLYQFLNYDPLEGFGKDIFFRKAEIYGRLSGPFLDMVPGSYISKFFIFGFIYLTLIIKDKKFLIFSSIIYISLCGLITFISGERMALATFVLAIFLMLILVKEYRLIFMTSFILFILSSFMIFKNHDHYQNYTILESKATHLGLTIKKLKKDCGVEENCSRIIKVQPKIDVVLKNFSKSAYYDAYSLAFEMFKSYPLTGIGMNNFKYGCLNKKEYKKEICWSHPHNFYLQSLTETGLIGFILFLIYIFKVFKICLINYNINKYSKYSFVALIVIFWPIMSTGSLLKNWHGIETFFIIGLCMTITNLFKNKIT